MMSRARFALQNAAVIALALAALALAARPQFRIAGMIASGLLFFFAATSLSRAGRLAGPLQRLRGESLEVHVWGAPLPGGPHRVHSIRAFGAGLNLWLQPRSGRDPVLLKIAQPRPGVIDALGVEIAGARYVQWAGKKLPRVDGNPAVVLVAASDGRQH